MKLKRGESVVKLVIFEDKPINQHINEKVSSLELPIGLISGVSLKITKARFFPCFTFIPLK